MDVFSTGGQQVYGRLFRHSPGELMEMDLRDLAPGIYSAHFRTDGAEVVKKLVIAQ